MGKIEGRSQLVYTRHFESGEEAVAQAGLVYIVIWMPVHVFKDA